MNTVAVRLYEKNDIRIESFPLPEIKEDEILMKVHADSLCMSTWKAVSAGTNHKRVPKDILENPIIIGHELSGELVEIGEKWKSKFSVGEKVTIQPALNYQGSMDSPGYSYRYCGGEATYIILPKELMLVDALIPVKTEAYYMSALSEPYSCVIGACRAMFRTSRVKHEHIMGLKEGGRLAIFGGCGPMGLAAIDYAMASSFKPSQIIVTDQVSKKIEKALSIFSPVAKYRGIDLKIINTASLQDQYTYLSSLTDDNLFDDILVMIPIPKVLELAESLLTFNGCLNFFAGPINKDFYARVNYYDIHYFEKHIIGTTGGNIDDQREALNLMEDGLIHPEALITHVGGLDSAVDATLRLPHLEGGKKLIYTQCKLPLFALVDLPVLSNTSDFYARLAKIVADNNGLWSAEAEKFVLQNAPKIIDDTTIVRKDK